MVSQQLPGEFTTREESREAIAGGLAYAACTDPGCEREVNEDRFLVVRSKSATGYFVFDGMGGQPGGDAAAEISAETIRAYIAGNDQEDVESEVQTAVELAQKQLLLRRRTPSMANMGTTVVGALVKGAELALVAVGDSRAYRIGGGTITQLTCDHTLVQQLVDSGQISQHDALVHPQSHILTRCLGSEVEFKVDRYRYWIWPQASEDEPTDMLLFCSDGLYSLVSEAEISSTVARLPLQDAARTLVQLARARGGFDNITVVLVPLNGRLVDAPPSQGEVGKRRSRIDTAPLRKLQDLFLLNRSESPAEETELARMPKIVTYGFALGALVSLGLVLIGLFNR